MVYKRCEEAGCTKAPRCHHPWYLKVEVNKQIEKGPVAKYAWLLDPGQRLPDSKFAAIDLEAKVRTWVARGRPAPTEPTADVRITTTIKTAAEDYLKRYVATELNCKGTPSIMARLIREKGDHALTDMLSRSVIKDMRDDIAEAHCEGTANSYMRRWSHFINWCRVEYKLSGTSPFFHKLQNPQGVRKFDVEWRQRRLEDSEEAALRLVLPNTRDAAVMVGRFNAALDGCFRRGEMLKVRREDVLWKDEARLGGLFIRLLKANTKGNEERLVPVATKRLRQFLETRRFAPFPFGKADGTYQDSFRAEWEEALLLSGLEAGKYVKGTTGTSKHRNWVKTKDADLHWHDLRHEGASRLLESKQMTIVEIQRLLGHKDIQTTMIYLNVRDVSFAQSMQRAQAGL